MKKNYPHVWNPSLKENIQFPQFTDASPEPILITDTGVGIYYVNPAWEKLTGYTFEEVKGKNPRFLQSGKTPRRVYETLWKNLKKGHPFSAREIINKKKNGEEFQVHATYFAIQRGRKGLFYVQMFHDITQQKHLEEQKDAFIGVASHELKTPITTLFAYSQILEKRLSQKGDEKDVYLLSNIIRETKRLTNLIDDLLNVSKIESGKLLFQPEEFDINELIYQVVMDFRYTTETHEIKREGVVEGNIIGDKNRIEQVLVNLLTNAIKYSPNADNVIVHLSKERKRAIIAIEDFGFGIARKDQPHIFKRFYRTQDKEEGKIPGFGLGLYISSEIIKKHKGKIWVKSKLNAGSTFFVSLPTKNNQ